MVLHAFPTCVDPFLVHGPRLVPSTVADHTRALDDGGTWKMENGRGMCESCHGRKSNLERRARRGHVRARADLAAVIARCRQVRSLVE